MTDNLAVKVEHLHFSYPEREPILRGLDFSLREGEVVVLAGLSGSGKTTLAYILCGLIPHLISGKVEGRVELFGQELTKMGTAAIAEQAALIFQDSDEQLICTTVEDELAFGPENLALPPEEICDRIDRTLDFYHLQDLRLCDPARLSGGQKKRVALAAVSTLHPRLMIFDEPLSGLDQAGQDLVTRQLAKLKLAGCTVLVIEHDLDAEYARNADRWLILADGRIAAFAAPEQLLHGPLLFDLELRYDD